MGRKINYMNPKIKSFLLDFAKGGAIGIANIIPGVSGGTIAVIVGIYDKLIESISNLFGKNGINKFHFIFLIKVIFGALALIFISSKIIVFLLNNYFELLMFSFIGIIIGSVPAIVKMHFDMRVTVFRITILLIGITLPVILSKFVNTEVHKTNSFFFEEIDIHNYLILLVTGILAGGTMVVPGISGSLIMVLLGQYSLVVYSVEQLKIKPLFFLAFGVFLGIFTFAKLMNFLFKKSKSVTLYFVLGLVLGSCYKIYPGLPQQINLIFTSIFVFLFGTGFSFFLSMIRIGKI